MNKDQASVQLIILEEIRSLLGHQLLITARIWDKLRESGGAINQETYKQAEETLKESNDTVEKVYKIL